MICGLMFSFLFYCLCFGLWRSSNEEWLKTGGNPLVDSICDNSGKIKVYEGEKQ